MKLISKIAAGAALLGAITAAQAEQMVFGATVEPIMSLEVEGRILPAEALITGADAAPADPSATSPTVGMFKVTTNVVKWDVKMSFENGGHLRTWAGVGFKTNDAAGAAEVTNGIIGAADSSAYIFVCPTAANGAAVATACTAINTEVGIAASGAPTTAVGFVGSAAVDFETTPIADLSKFAAALSGGTMIYNLRKNAIAFDIRTHVEGASVAALAGTYTETLNLSLYGSY